jgi:hypothetical protein
VVDGVVMTELGGCWVRSSWIGVGWVVIGGSYKMVIMGENGGMGVVVQVIICEREKIGMALVIGVSGRCGQRIGAWFVNGKRSGNGFT